MKRSELIETIMQRMGNIKRLTQAQQYHCTNGETLGGAQLSVLFAIKKYAPISSHALATKLSMTPGGISQLLESLLANGLVAKQNTAGDRRSFTLSISSKGSELAKRVWDTHYAILEHSTANFSEAELAMFISMLEKMAAALEVKAET